ncbi:hypothetical protein LCGC14_0849440 [marine sediment metagenome]|uniref:Uncharacterized protein n=1 Tax=marine sediment metagenome TaxID=412755 RepID=A0A0F9RVH8_9ZZZZ
MADQWYGINSGNIVSYCGWTRDGMTWPETLANALNGNSGWFHEVDHIHWFKLDLGGAWDIKLVRGRSQMTYGDPWFADVYVSNGINGPWTQVAFNINTWRDTAIWQVINNADATGRYVLVEITECEWHASFPGRDWIRWGTLWGPTSWSPIFDVYGSAVVPITVVNLSGWSYPGCTATATMPMDIPLAGVASPIAGTLANLTGIVIPLGGFAIPSCTTICTLSGTDQEGIIAAQSFVAGYLTGGAEILSSTCISEIEGGGRLFGTISQPLASNVIVTTMCIGELTLVHIDLAATSVSNTTVLGILDLKDIDLASNVIVNTALLGTLDNKNVELVGVITATTVCVGTLDNIRLPMVSTITCDLTTTAALTVILIPGSFLVGGTILAQSSLTGVLGVYDMLVGITVGVSTVVGSLHCLRELVGSINCASTSDGSLKRICKLSGIITMTSTVTSTLTIPKPLTGIITTISTFNGLAVVTRKLVGIVTSQCTMGGRLAINLRGTVSMINSTTGTIKLSRELKPTCDGLSTIEGILGVAGRIAGSLTVQSSVNGTLHLVRKLVGQIDCTSSLNGNIIPYKMLSGLITGQSIFSVAYHLRLIKKIQTVTITAYCTPNGSLSRVRRLISILTATSSLTATVSIDLYMVGTISCISTFSGSLVYAILSLKATVTCTSSTNGTLKRNILLTLRLPIFANSTVDATLGFYVIKYLICDVTVQPIFTQTVIVLPFLTQTVINSAILTHLARNQSILEATLNNEPILSSGLRVNERFEIAEAINV